MEEKHFRIERLNQSEEEMINIPETYGKLMSNEIGRSMGQTKSSKSYWGYSRNIRRATKPLGSSLEAFCLLYDDSTRGEAMFFERHE